MGGFRGVREGARGPDPQRKSQVAVGFLRNTGTDPRLEKQLDPLGPIAFRGRSVRPSVKYVDD